MKHFKLSLGLLATLAYVPAAMAAPSPILDSDIAQFSVFGGIGGATNAPTMYGDPLTPTTLSNSLGTINTTPTGITGFYGAKNNEATGVVVGYGGPGAADKNSNIHQDDALAKTSYDELKTAQSTLMGMRTDGITEFGDMAGMTILPGVYSLTGGMYNLSSHKKVTLDGNGDANAQWVFLGGSDIKFDTYSTIDLINIGDGAGASVYWNAVSSITINTGATMVGNFLALTSITMGANAQITCGRALDGALADGGNVTMISNTITSSNCSNGSMSGLNGIAGSASPSAVPEPESYTLVLAGMGVMGFLSRRRKS